MLIPITVLLLKKNMLNYQKHNLNLINHLVVPHNKKLNRFLLMTFNILLCLSLNLLKVLLLKMYMTLLNNNQITLKIFIPKIFHKILILLTLLNISNIRLKILFQKTRNIKFFLILLIIANKLINTLIQLFNYMRIYSIVNTFTIK